jgi:hypothetical protein
VEPRAGLDDVEKRKFLTLSGLELRPLGRPARTQSYTDCAIPASKQAVHIIPRTSMVYEIVLMCCKTVLHLTLFEIV